MNMRGDSYTKFLRLRIKEAKQAQRFFSREHTRQSGKPDGHGDDFDEAQRQWGIAFGLTLALTDYRTAKGWLRPHGTKSRRGEF
jgi:hypothetical protein